MVLGSTSWRVDYDCDEPDEPATAAAAKDAASDAPSLLFLAVGNDDGGGLYLESASLGVRAFAAGSWSWREVLDLALARAPAQVVLVFPTTRHVGAGAPELWAELQRRKPAVCGAALWRSRNTNDLMEMAEAAVRQPSSLHQHAREAVAAREVVSGKGAQWLAQNQRQLVVRFASQLAAVSRVSGKKRQRQEQPSPSSSSAVPYVVDVSQQQALPPVALQTPALALSTAMLPSAAETALRFLQFIQLVPVHNRQSLADMVRVRVATPCATTEACLAAIEGRATGDVGLLDLVCPAGTASATGRAAADRGIVKEVFETARLCAHVMLRISV